MLTSKPKPSLSEPSNHKEPSNANPSSNSNHRVHASASAPRVRRLVKHAGPSKPEMRAPSPLHNARIPLDKSSASVDVPKPSPGERRPFKATTTHRTTSTTAPDKQPRIVKTSELQARLNLVQEDLKNARDHLASIEKDKAQALDNLALTKSLADEAYEKLEESLIVQRRAEEALELEKFKSIEREQSSIELAQRKEEEWKRKYDNLKKRHAEDVVSLISATRELENAKDELAVTIQAKNLAISHADEVKQIADANAKQVEILMTEVTRLKTLLDSELGNKAKEAAEIINKLQSEASELRAELQKAKAFEEKLTKAEELVEGLKVDIACAKRAQVDANQLAEEWKTKAESLEARLVEASSLNKSNDESLASLTKSLEDCTSMLQDRQSEVLQLKEMVASLESEASEYKEGFLETNGRVDIVRKEASELQASIDRLRSEHELLNNTHQQVVSNEKAVNTQVGVLSEDKFKLLQELDDTREERDKVKRAVEDLAAALREVSSEAREAKERALTKQTVLDNAQFQISELKAAMKNAEDKYQLMLEESNYETACLRKTVERLGSEAKSSKDEWVSKEAGFVDMLNRSEEGISSIKSEMSKLVESLRVAEKEVQELKAEKTQLHSTLKVYESNTMDASSTAEKTKAESSHLNGLVSNKEEEEVLALNHEVTDLRLRETGALAKANELSKLLAEATARKAEEEDAAKSTEKSKALLIKLEMDKVLESLKAAEHEAKAAKDDKAQLQTKLRLLESKITEANLTAEEEKISSLRLKEMLADKENELLSIARENDGLRTREAAAQAKIDELSTLLIEATAKKEESNGVVAVRSPEKQTNVFLKMICSPMDNVRDDEPRKNSDRIVQVEEIKHVKVETIKQVKNEKEEISAVEANSLENSKMTEDDLSKERGNDTDEPSDDDIESQADDGLVDQANGLLINGPTSSFNQEQHNHKKKKALLKKFRSLLKKKAHFTKLSNHS